VALKMVGAGQFMPKVERLIADRYADLDIELEDWVHFSEMPGFLGSIDIGLLPLIQAGNLWIDSKSPTKYFEYLASGLPTVGSPTRELRRFIRDGENGYLAGDKEEFIRKMTRLVEDRALRAEMGRRAKRLVEEKFSIQHLGKELWSAIGGVAG
jgi:glycosyltransferase involved in cell wall biosynthesis